MEDTTLDGNTHSMDGKWKHFLNKIQDHKYYTKATLMKIQIESDRNNLPPEMKKLESGILRCCGSVTASKYFNAILFGNGNYDHTNQIDALLLLCFISLLPEEEGDIYKTLSEQLSDAQNGSCPQGRTTRLAQVIDSYI